MSRSSEKTAVVLRTEAVMKMCEMYEKVSAFVAVDIERVKRDLMPQVKDDIYIGQLWNSWVMTL